MPGDQVERLWPPVSWWLAGAGTVGAVCLVLAVSTPGVVVTTGTTVATVLVLCGLLTAGRVQVGVRGGEVVAGRAHVPLARCGRVEALDAHQARAARGVDSDARAFLLLRPYLPLAVRVELADPADPTPYWLLSARRPDLVAQAAATARSPRRDDPRTAR